MDENGDIILVDNQAADITGLGTWNFGDYEISLTYQGNSQDINPTEHYGSLIQRINGSSGVAVFLFEDGDLKYGLTNYGSNNNWCGVDMDWTQPADFVFKKEGNLESVYINGVLECSDTYSGSPPSNISSAPLRFGGHYSALPNSGSNGGYYQSLEGTISNIQLSGENLDNNVTSFYDCQGECGGDALFDCSGQCEGTELLMSVVYVMVIAHHVKIVKAFQMAMR